MLGKLSVAFLLAATPALAADPESAPAPNVEAPEQQEYTTKKVCRTYEVAGSFIPRRTCVNKRIPVKKPAPATPEAVTEGGASDGAGKEQ
jgi:hypothetical protein